MEVFIDWKRSIKYYKFVILLGREVFTKIENQFIVNHTWNKNISIYKNVFELIGLSINKDENFMKKEW